jgi:PadR family transcriptional regulator PadR
VKDFLDNWLVQARKGLIELCVLNALAGGERYAYDLCRSLMAIPGLGVTEGTLYPLLSRLRMSGLVSTRLEESPEGPARKYYRLTPEGRETMRIMNEQMDQLADGTRRLRRRGD